MRPVKTKITDWEAVMAPVNGYRLPLPVRQKHCTNQCSDQSQSLSLRLSPFHHRCPWSIAGTPWAVAGPWLTRLTERKKEPSTGVAKGALRSTSKLVQICDLINALHTSYHDTTSSMYIYILYIYIYACVCVCVCVGLCVCAYLYIYIYIYIYDYICVCVVCVCVHILHNHPPYHQNIHPPRYLHHCWATIQHSPHLPDGLQSDIVRKTAHGVLVKAQKVGVTPNIQVQGGEIMVNLCN